MQRRSPARYLAPLALIIAMLAVYGVVQGESEMEPAATTASTTSVSTAAKSKAKKPASSSSKSYTVKSGDTLSGIAEKTGVTLEMLLELNDVDANSLNVGRKLKLRR